MRNRSALKEAHGKYPRAAALGVAVVALVVVAISGAATATARPATSHKLSTNGRSQPLAKRYSTNRVVRNAGRPLAPSPQIRPDLTRPRASAAIVGGIDASQGLFPFMAFIVYAKPPWISFCSGTVVSANLVLTAGHCGLDESTAAFRDPSNFTVVTGAADPGFRVLPCRRALRLRCPRAYWTDSRVRQVSRVSRVIVDPAYDPVRHTADAALLVLATPTSVPSLRLAGSADLSLEQRGTGAVIAGWGETSLAQQWPSENLQFAVTVVQYPAYCGLFDPAFAAAQELCAANLPYGHTGTCHGDSGGPLMAADDTGHLVEIGITSWGPPDCNTASADFFTRVAPLTPWIVQEIRAAIPRRRHRPIGRASRTVTPRSHARLRG
jgi:secreted trypsin-like serine protease